MKKGRHRLASKGKMMQLPTAPPTCQQMCWGGMIPGKLCSRYDNVSCHEVWLTKHKTCTHLCIL